MRGGGIEAKVDQAMNRIHAMAAAAAVFAGAAAAAAIPLPEHPRPDWERPQWMNLNGRWDFGFSEGVYDMEISVPFGWGSPLSGVKNVEGGDTGFYRRKVTVPQEWKGKRVFIVVGAADHDTEFRFDGKVLGTHSGGYTPFEFEITGMVRWGAEQTAEFKIRDPDSSFANGGRHLFGKQEYGNVRGIWQTVYLEARGKDYIDSARFTPCIAKSSVKAELRLASPAGGPLVAEVALDGKTARVPFAKGESAKSVDIALASPRLWDLDSPELYDVTLTLGDDTVKTYFGFREVGVGKNANGDPYVTLNGRPVYLQMCLDQSYHPEGYYTFPTDESMKNEIMISKKLALSGNRVHIKVEVPRKLYWADRLGLLIQADVPNAWGPACDGMFAEHWKCFEGMVKRDFNHPSIYQWTLFNETWGLLSRRYGEKGGKYTPATQRRVADAYRRAKALDPTRLVDDNSACLRDHVATDVNTWHRYCPAYGWYDKLERVCAKTYPGSKCNYAKDHAQNGAPMMNAECGNVWGYHGSTGDCDFTWDYHAMINAFRSHLKCGGWLYTEHHDVIVEWNGYVREDRTWKETGLEELAGMTLADFHGKAALFMQKRRGYETGEIVRPGEKVVIPVGVSFVTDGFARKKLTLSKSAWWFDGAGRKVSAGATQEKGMFPAKSWQCEKLWDVEFIAPEGPACGCVVFDLMADGERIARNFWSFSTVANDAAMPKPKAAEWSEGTSEVMGGLKLNGFGKGWFEYEVAVPPQGGTFRAELSAKRKNWKDCKDPGRGIDYPAGKRTLERSKNPNSYPQTCEHKFPANLTVSVGGKVALKRILPDDPADHRGLLSWLAQPHDGRLREAGSYGWLVEVDIPPEAVKDGKAAIRLESDAGLAVYGPRFGRYPLGPSVSAASVSVEDFASPQGAARENTGPLFWLHGTETEARLREYVGRVAESGQGILTIESRPHKDWMHAGWWRDVDIVLDECKKRGLKMMVFDDYWWPSQGMGGKCPIPKEFQCRDVKGKVYPKGKAPAKVKNEIARIVVKEVSKGVFEPMPDGDKTIVYSWFTARGGLPTVNGLDEAAVDWFLANMYQPYYDRYGAEFRDGTIVGFFFDEPVFGGWWGDALAKELAARGDDAGELFTARKFRLADPDAQARATYRLFDARAEVWGRTMYGRQSDWCRKRGVYSSGHFLEHEKCYYDAWAGCGNVMQLMKYVEVPGVDLVCRQYYPNQREDRRRQIDFGQMPKNASSTAHVYNRHNGKNWCEIFGAYGQDLTYPQMKWLCDWHQYQGCYYLIPHSFNPKSPQDTDCPPYFYNGGKEPRSPLFRVWADYNNRCAMLLSEGEHVCAIAQCVPGLSAHVGKTIRPEMFAFAIQDAQLDSDWIGYDAVESAKICTNPRTGRPALRTADGKEWYDILTLPATEYVPFATLEKALAFAKAGGVVVGYGIKPCKTPTKGRTNEDARKTVDEIFAQPTALFIDGEPDGATLRAALAKNYPGEDRPLAVREFDFPGLAPEDGRMLAVNHYVKDGRETLFIANQDCARRRDLAVRAKWPAGEAGLWDPMQGTVEKPKVENGLVKLALEPSQAVFLVWPCGALGDRALPWVGMPNGEAIAAAVKETVTPVAVEGLKDGAIAPAHPFGPLAYAQWIWHPVDPKAQGKVEFDSNIDVAAADDAEIVFSCDNAAIVCVNGKEVAKQEYGDDYNGWRTPTRAKFRLRPGRNEIKVLADNPLPGYAGFVCSIRWSAGMLLSEEDSWTVRREGGPAVKPRGICRFGRGVWGRLGSAPGSTGSPFAESVATELAFTLPEPKQGARVYFVCDDVAGEKSAAVTVNGVYAGGFIGAPYRIDITKAVKGGANTLEAKPFRLVRPRIVVVE